MKTEQICQHCGKATDADANAIGGLCPECLIKVGLGAPPAVAGAPPGASPGPRSAGGAVVMSRCARLGLGAKNWLDTLRGVWRIANNN